MTLEDLEFPRAAVIELERYLDGPGGRPEHEDLITTRLLHWDAGARDDGGGGLAQMQPSGWHITPAGEAVLLAWNMRPPTAKEVRARTAPGSTNMDNTGPHQKGKEVAE